MSRFSDLENQMVGEWGSKQSPLVNPNAITIPAGVYAPQYPIERSDSGTAAMTGLTIPYAGFQGRYVVIAGGAFTWTTATNIAAAGTAVANKTITFTYDPITAKWYASI